MSGRQVFTQTQAVYKKKIKKAKLFHEEAVKKLEDDDNDASDALRSSSESAIQLACQIEDNYGNEVIKLHNYKDLSTFYAKHRDYVCQYEDMAFTSFRRLIPKDISPVKASAVATKDSVLATLATLARAQGQMANNDDDKDFVENFYWVKETWENAIIARGLSLKDYEMVRDFKWRSNCMFHDAVPAADALLLLNSPASVSAELQMYKKPLRALLALLPKSTN